MWEIIERPGFSGKKKAEKEKQWDEKYGEGLWRIAWEWNDEIITKELAYQLYEDAYYQDSYDRPDVWEELRKTARDVYDIEKRDVESGIDYFIQKGIATHLQDISVRRVMIRRGWKFEGEELVRIRQSRTYWGSRMSPGKVPFHLPELILEPHLPGWWEYNSIEDFYQSNKVLQADRP